MMAIVPALMVLYSTDAVEIRYSDGSSLELSPCGSSMNHVEPPNTRGYSRCSQSKKVQKRTRFVTSEFRHKVLQALDFRNRFAERSYLCDDLLPRDEIVALYAKIDKIVWPQKRGEARIDVLPDGSRSITSLDEFATLIVSPHSHDFTVCFLSRISPDKGKSKDAAMQKSDSVSHGASLKSSSEKTCSFDAKCSTKLNQVLIHPFDKSGHLDARLPNNISQSEVTKDLQELKIKTTFAASQMKSGHLVSDNLASQEVSTGYENGEIHKCNTENEQKTKSARECSDSAANISCIQNNEGCSAKLIDKPDVHCNADSMSKEEKCHSSASFSVDCPNSFDISSISRSSTPDGLRTTVELDATLPHDIQLSSFQGQMLDRRQRRNSPTHTSSPYDAPPGLPSKNPDLIKKQEDVSLSSSFLGNQKVQNHRKESSSKPKMTQLVEFSDLGKDNSFSTTVNDSTRVAVNGFQLETSAVQINEPISCLPNELDCSNTVKCPKQIGIESDITSIADKTLRKVPKTPGNSDIIEHSDQIGASSDLTNSAANTARTVCFKTSSGYNSSQAEVDDIPGSVPGSEGRNFDGHEVNKGEYTNERQCRERYIWTTKHCSTNDCPIVWAHPLKLVLETGDLTKEVVSHNPGKERQPSTLADRENCIFTRVPSPLPATCPLQHNHRWMSKDSDDDDEDSATISGALLQGRLKVVISEGVVYRLAHKADVKTVEIYPGDGSVFVSHGIQGHFFTHYLLVGDQLQERTYSLKSLPHRQSQVNYSIKRLIETANRLSQMNATWEHPALKEDVPCWKKEVVAVVEPLSSSVLEECVVEGLGKFSAFTNGRMRIVFEDRTALDMVCNVSRRVQECFRHSQEPLVSLPCASSVSPPMPTQDSIFGASTGRLLLPSGEYVTVDIKHPGPYRKYIEVAQEWAAWVRSSPLERQQFYANYNTPAIVQQAVEIELKKIFCFNYILEQTLLMQQQQLNSIKSSSLSNSNIPSSEHAADIHPSDIPRPQPVGCHTDTVDSHHDPQPPFDPPVPGDEFRRTSKPTFPTRLTRSSDAFISNKNLPASSDQSGTGLCRDGSTDSHAHQDTSPRVKFKSCRISENAAMDFESVRQVLLQNSNLISEIDLFLESSRKV